MHPLSNCRPHRCSHPNTTLCCPPSPQHLNNCKQLHKLLIVAPNLKLLHVGGCKALTSMSLRCAQLTQLLANLCFKWVWG